MKIKLENWEIDTSTFVRIEWHKPFPKLVLHEKYEKNCEMDIAYFNFNRNSDKYNNIVACL